MSRFSAASAFSHAQPARTAVLLVQLGTPERPEAGPVRRYLRQFLSDPRVVEIPRAIWWPILNGAILPTRPARSARKYASIWTDKGSPLLVHTKAQASLVRGYLGNEGLDVDVAFAMRYGEPSIGATLRELREKNLTRLLVVPMYPQYAGSTTATVFDEVARELSGWRNLPELRFVRGFHDQAAYIDALAARVRQSWGNDGPPDVLLMSFHGVPRRSLLAGDPYHCECLATGRLLAEKLQLPGGRWQVSFQSRFGRAEWLQPYTEATLKDLAKAGHQRVDVVCPGFVADCLETLEEIAIEARETFLAAGGADFRYIPCLNDRPEFIRALTSLVQAQTSGWRVSRKTPGKPGGDPAADPVLIARAQRAKALGAVR
ncbi:MAG: ferrochelatase [Burkholderiaceae bacterium]